MQHEIRLAPDFGCAAMQAPAKCSITMIDFVLSPVRILGEKKDYATVIP